MNRHIQIVLSAKPGSNAPGAGGKMRPLDRLKLLLTGVLFATVAIAVLVAALLVGSVIAAALWIAIVVLAVAVILKNALRRARR
jgi:hypothetical protein